MIPWCFHWPQNIIQQHPIVHSHNTSGINCTTGKCRVCRGFGSVMSQLIMGPVRGLRSVLWSNNETDTTRQTVSVDSLLHHVIHHWYRNVQSIIPKLACYIRLEAIMIYCASVNWDLSGSWSWYTKYNDAIISMDSRREIYIKNYTYETASNQYWAFFVLMSVG